MEQFDENKYNRQIYVIGVEAMNKLTRSSVLICGCGGVGIEIAKNLLLAGVQTVTVQDTKKTTIEDLASNFYLNESNIGKNRAESVFDNLRSLNRNANINISTDSISNSIILDHQCVVITEIWKLSELISLSEFCHSNSIKLIIADARGLFGFIFTDFGDSHIITDPSGEEPIRFEVTNVTKHKLGVVSVPKKSRHNLQNGDRVRFEGVEGMVELNQNDFPVRVHDDRHIVIGDTRKFGVFSNSKRTAFGIQVIQPKTESYESLEKALKNPQLMCFDFCSPGRDEEVFLLYLTLCHATEKYPFSSITEEGFRLSLSEIRSKYGYSFCINDHVLKTFLNTYQFVISPMSSVIGGISAQEVLKAITGKFTPLKQFLCIGYYESAPLFPQYSPQNDRYDPYRKIFGNELQDRIQKLKYFLIGAGALGCEILKNWAMMGVGTKGRLTVTDMDKIERSNLSRQFLFHDEDIGKMKSIAAAQSVLKMNPSLNIEALPHRIGEDTTSIFNDSFYENIDGVCNALDNIPARKFSDQMCLFYKKPMLESGTLGTKANYQMIIPYLTESYSSTADPEEKGIPFCTLHYFHSNIDHCTMWAREMFSKVFEIGPESVNKYIGSSDYLQRIDKQDPGAYIPTIKTIIEYLSLSKPSSWHDCVCLARERFDQYFNFQIRDILHKNPPNSLEDGKPFWAGTRRCPHPIDFNPEDPFHLNFVYATARLYADTYGISVGGKNMEIKWLHKYKEWTPNMEQPEENQVTEEMEQFIKDLRNSNPLSVSIFEKDDDNNGHIDFIAAAANMRAICFDILPNDKLQIKKIAGRIIPAISTTTAMVCGFVMLEMYKVHFLAPLPISSFRSGFFNLANNIYVTSNPNQSQIYRVSTTNEEFSMWTSWIFRGDITMKELIDCLSEKALANVEMISCKGKLLYFGNRNAEQIDTKVSELVSKLGLYDTSDPNHFYIQVTALISKGEEYVEIPNTVIKYK